MKNKNKNITLSEQVNNPMEKIVDTEAKSTPTTHA